MSTKVRPGYKQTEVGVIPEDWEVTRLGEHATFKTGPFGSTLHKSDYVHGGVPVINPMQIADGKIQPTQSMAITEEAARKLSDFRLSVGNVIIGRRGEMGRCAVVMSDQDGWLCGTGSMVIRTEPSLDASFLQRLLSSPPVVAAIKSTSVGTTMINLNHGTLGHLLIPIPPTKAEQEAIAEALSDADALIESLKQLIAKKRHLKQGAMQELLTGKRRLSGFSGEWEVSRLGDLGNWKGGMTPSMREARYWQGGTVPWISSGDVKSVKLSTTGFCITQYAIKCAATTLLPASAIIVVTRSGILRKYLPVATNVVPMAINQDIKALLVKDGTFTDYVLQSLLAHGDQILSRCLKSGTTVESIELRWLKAFTIPFPGLPEQIAIADVLSDMDAEIAAVEAKLAKARQVKQGMMQELLTGRIRLV